MAYTISKVQVWVGDIPNRPGTLARVLEGLSGAGACLEFLIARKLDDATSRVFVAPLKTANQKQAAANVGLSLADMNSIRIEGPDRPGLGAQLSRAVADAGVNIRGASAAALGKRAVFYLAFDSPADAKKAAAVLRKALAPRKR
jgi:hypothetical protein